MLLLDYWLPLADYENRYEGSFAGFIRNRETKVLKIYHINKTGYWAVNMPPKGCKRVHRLIAKTFIPNPNNKPEVNHLDGDKLNCRASNFEWVTQMENKLHAMANGLVKTAIHVADDVVETIKKLSKTHTVKEISEIVGLPGSRVYDFVDTRDYFKEKIIIDINYGIFYEGATEVAELLQDKPRNITRLLRGERPNRTTLRYANWDGIEYTPDAPPKRMKKLNPVAKFDANGNLVQRYSDMKYVGNPVFRQRVGAFLNGLCRDVDGFYWKRINCSGEFIEPPKFVSKRRKRAPTPENKTQPKSVIKFDENGNELRRFCSIGEAAKSVGTNKKVFGRQIKKNKRGFYKGFIYKICH